MIQDERLHFDVPLQAGTVMLPILSALLGAVLGTVLYRAARQSARGGVSAAGAGHMRGLRARSGRGGANARTGGAAPARVLPALFFSVLTVACLLRFGAGAEALRNEIFLACLFFLTLTDWACCEIPDGCLLVAALAWVCSVPFLGLGWQGFLRGLGAGLGIGAGLLALSLGMDALLKKESLGGGDIKLFAVVGLYLGFVGSLLALLLACLLGLLMAAVLKKRPGQPFPFGPAIAVSAAALLFWGEAPVRWYLRLLM